MTKITFDTEYANSPTHYLDALQTIALLQSDLADMLRILSCNESIDVTRFKQVVHRLDYASEELKRLAERMDRPNDDT